VPAVVFFHLFMSQIIWAKPAQHHNSSVTTVPDFMFSICLSEDKVVVHNQSTKRCMQLTCFSFNLANSDGDKTEKETNLKESLFTCSEKTADHSNLASPLKKESAQKETTADFSLVPQEQPEC